MSPIIIKRVILEVVSEYFGTNQSLLTQRVFQYRHEAKSYAAYFLRMKMSGYPNRYIGEELSLCESTIRHIEKSPNTYMDMDKVLEIENILNERLKAFE